MRTESAYLENVPQTEAWQAAVTICVGARIVNSLCESDYVHVQIQAFPKQWCVGTMDGSFLVRGTESLLCGPCLQTILYINHKRQSQTEQSLGLLCFHYSSLLWISCQRSLVTVWTRVEWMDWNGGLHGYNSIGHAFNCSAGLQVLRRTIDYGLFCNSKVLIAHQYIYFFKFSHLFAKTIHSVWQLELWQVAEWVKAVSRLACGTYISEGQNVVAWVNLA